MLRKATPCCFCSGFWLYEIETSPFRLYRKGGWVVSTVESPKEESGCRHDKTKRFVTPQSLSPSCLLSLPFLPLILCCFNYQESSPTALQAAADGFQRLASQVHSHWREGLWIPGTQTRALQSSLLGSHWFNSR